VAIVDDHPSKLRLERKDKIGIAGIVLGSVSFVLTLLTVVGVPLLNSHFQTKMNAVMEQAQIRETHAVDKATCDAHQADYREHIKNTAKFEALLVNVKINQEVRMKTEGLGRRIKHLPAGMRIDPDAGMIIGDPADID
jgi:hypothetical protein